MDYWPNYSATGILLNHLNTTTMDVSSAANSAKCRVSISSFPTVDPPPRRPEYSDNNAGMYPPPHTLPMQHNFGCLYPPQAPPQYYNAGASSYHLSSQPPTYYNYPTAPPLDHPPQGYRPQNWAPTCDLAPQPSAPPLLGYPQPLTNEPYQLLKSLDWGRKLIKKYNDSDNGSDDSSMEDDGTDNTPMMAKD